MTRILPLSVAALALAAMTSVSVAQVGSSTGGTGARSTGRSATTTAPRVLPVPRPATNPNSLVAPSAASLPGGGTQVPQSAGSGIGSAVPIYGVQNNSSIGGSINESAQRSSDTDCTGAGTRSSTGSGSTSTTTVSCAAGSSLGTQSIMGSGSAIDVTR
jgi:hypothetical protein